jgi:hypothetical protein
VKPRLPDGWRRYAKRRMADLILDGMEVELASIAARAEAFVRWRASIKFGKIAAERATVEWTDEGGAIVSGATDDVPRSKLARATRPTLNII